MKNYLNEALKIKTYKTELILLTLFVSSVIFLSCSSIDYIGKENPSLNSNIINAKEISLVTYNIKAIYDKEKDQINNLMAFIKNGDFDFVLFQELFDESMRDEIIEKSDTANYKTIISRVDYNSFPEFIFQDAGLFMMSKYPRIDLSSLKFGSDIKNSNGVIHMILEKEISKTNDFLANKSVLGTLFNINDSTQLFLFTTHVQAIGTREHKQFQLKQIYGFVETAVKKIIESKVVDLSENLIVMLAGDFNNNAYSSNNFSNLLKPLGYPRDLHKEFHGNKEEYTFAFRSRKPSRRFDYIFSYDKIENIKFKKISVKSINAEDVKDDNSKSISDHLALKATLLIN